MTDDQKDKIRDRVRKLLNTARNHASTDGEVHAALIAAKSLMRKHHITEEQCLEVDSLTAAKKKVDLGHKDKCGTSIGGRLYAWESHLTFPVMELVGGVKCFVNHGKKLARDFRGNVMMHPIWNEEYKGKTVFFYGLAEDAVIAAEMFETLRAELAEKSRKKYGSCYTGDGGMYCQGWVQGLQAQIKQHDKSIENNATGTGLIVLSTQTDLIKYKTEQADRWLRESEGVKLGKGAAYDGANGSYTAYRQGKIDGETADVSVNRKAKIG